MSPRSPLERSITPSSKYELLSSPVQSRIQRIIERLLVLVQRKPVIEAECRNRPPWLRWSLLLVSVVAGGWPDLSSEDRVADHRVEQHEREDDDARSPEHEGETGMGC